MAFLMEETVGRKFSAVIGFASREDAAAAAKTIQGLPRPARK